MKRLVCDSCGSTKFITATDDIKVCKFCQSQYFSEKDIRVLKTKYIVMLTAVLCVLIIVFLPQFLVGSEPELAPTSGRRSGMVYHEAGRETLLNGLENIERLNWTREIFENIIVAERDRTQTGVASYVGGDHFHELVELVGSPGADTSVRLTHYTLNHAVWNGIDTNTRNHIAVTVIYIEETGMITEIKITGGQNQFR